MTSGPDPRLPGRVAGIAAAITVMGAVVVMVGPGLLPGDTAPSGIVAPIAAPERTIPAEAGVFRTRPGDLSADPGAARRPEAHARTLVLYRRLRAFPGAPPRVPHGLTAAEFRGAACLGCHERGGFVERFAAYAPVTPHPEWSQCLQCHLPDDELVGIPFSADPSGPVCLQCHVLDVQRPLVTELDWRAAAWPDPSARALPGAPPPVPHDLQLRGNCLACHMGAGVVEGLRTSHPELADCRQCHVQGSGHTDPGAPAHPVGAPEGGGS